MMCVEYNLPIKSTDSTLEKIVESNFIYNIPIYQRLYVWGKDQIEILLDDLVKAFNNGVERYYLGGIMVTKTDKSDLLSNQYDLIDGQQRFTTLWLISRYLKNDLLRFSNVNVENKSIPRISFSARDFANLYFSNGVDFKGYTKQETEELKPLRIAVEIIDSYFKNERWKIEIEERFASYIFSKVFFVITEMPGNIDENKVFEAMNNRGVQLQQHEILKSMLLKQIKDPSDRSIYAQMWDACSKMDNYLEKNIKDITNLTWITLFPETETNEKDVKLSSDIFVKLKSLKDQRNNSNESKKDTYVLSLLDILKNEISEDLGNFPNSNNNSLDNDEYESAEIRSIISFPMLLLHTLRIHQKRNKNIDANLSAEVDGKNLIKIFNYYYSKCFKEEDDVTAFLNLLWKVREKFDLYVIKWVLVEQEGKKAEHHVIQHLYQTKTSLQRKKITGNDELAMLQSMLYHSQQLVTHYWLTPFLDYLVSKQDEDLDHVAGELDRHFNYLEGLDNAMFCIFNNSDLRIRSYNLMNVELDLLKGDVAYIKKKIQFPSGVGFQHYLFYKTEYILWKNRKKVLENEQDRKWDNYKMTSKNSIEHIFPQNPRLENKEVEFISTVDAKDFVFEWSDESEDYKKDKIKCPFKDDFGNLVLLSAGMNSEYSNKSYGEKKEQFKNKSTLDSLKSALIFKEDNWNWEKALAHRNKIIGFFEAHLTKD